MDGVKVTTGGGGGGGGGNQAGDLSLRACDGAP